MEVRPHRIINRKKTKKISVGNVLVGGDTKISVQSMTNTLTTDIKELFDQADDKYAVMCVQHDYKVKEEFKILFASALPLASILTFSASFLADSSLNSYSKDICS